MWIHITAVQVSEKQLKKVDRHKVLEHQTSFEHGKFIMPIDVVKVSEEKYCICGNGRHRYFGAVNAGIEMIEVNVLNQ